VMFVLMTFPVYPHNELFAINYFVTKFNQKKIGLKQKQKIVKIFIYLFKSLFLFVNKSQFIFYFHCWLHQTVTVKKKVFLFHFTI
jgi:hypothetical protein